MTDRQAPSYRLPALYIRSQMQANAGSQLQGLQGLSLHSCWRIAFGEGARGPSDARAVFYRESISQRQQERKLNPPSSHQVAFEGTGFPAIERGTGGKRQSALAELNERAGSKKLHPQTTPGLGFVPDARPVSLDHQIGAEIAKPEPQLPYAETSGQAQSDPQVITWLEGNDRARETDWIT